MVVDSPAFVCCSPCHFTCNICDIKSIDCEVGRFRSGLSGLKSSTCATGGIARVSGTIGGCFTIGGCGQIGGCGTIRGCGQIGGCGTIGGLILGSVCVFLFVEIGVVLLVDQAPHVKIFGDLARGGRIGAVDLAVDLEENSVSHFLALLLARVTGVDLIKCCELIPFGGALVLKGVENLIVVHFLLSLLSVALSA